jgi:hypothetical protein
VVKGRPVRHLSWRLEWGVRVGLLIGGDDVDAVPSRLSGPVIGCLDASRLAEFYAALLRWNVGGRVTVMLDPAGHPFCLFPGKV